ncbi:MAG: TonB-dependent receptor [Tannerella sp.]|jgi:TonB-linked SusC/RagA family outer membrane protein|nr:TonB-dependent receptor [Tannerella sp.]
MKIILICLCFASLRSLQSLKKTVLLSLSVLVVTNVNVFARIPNNATGVEQVKTITGTVKDNAGEPLPGATIVVTGSNNGTATDADGAFVLSNVPENSTLSISYIGYVTQMLSVSGKERLDIVLLEETLSMDEVVVIGYGVQKKSNVTGAISSVKADDLKNLPVTDMASALQGKVSGVQVINNSGAPGASATIRIRGVSSNGVSDPLFVVDGLKVKDLGYLNPSNIESIEILKDAASAAIYGAEAGNGVVLVTTKSGGKTSGKITFETQLTTSRLAKKTELLNAEEYINYYTELSPSFIENLNKYYYNEPSSTINGKLVDTDWQDEMYSTGFRQMYNLGFQGGNDKGSLYVSLGFLDNNGMVTGNKDTYNRVTGQFNGAYKIKKWLEVGVNNSIESTKTGVVSESSVEYGNFISMINLINPLTPVEYANGLEGASPQVQDAVARGFLPVVNPKTGNYYGVSWLNDDTKNVLASIAREDESNEVFKINGMAFANLTPFKDFVFTSRLGYRFSSISTSRFMAPSWMSAESTSNDPYLEVRQTAEKYYQWENFANYGFDLGGSRFSLLAGMSYISSRTNYMATTTNRLSNPAPNFRYLNYSSSDASDNVFGNIADRVQFAYYGRVGWSYENRYDVQFNFRADTYDAAYLDLEHNWGYFPSISAGWTLTNEKFMENRNRDILSTARLRASYGKNGSISNLGGYMYASTLNAGPDIWEGTVFTLSNNSYWMNNELYTGLYPSEYLANPSLKWEESTQLGIGADLHLLNSRLLVTADYYNKKTNGLLVRSTAPLTTGTTYMYQNLGQVTNHGFEFDAEWKDHINDFKYSIKANIATVANKVTKFKGDGIRIDGSKLTSGSTVSYFEEGYPLWYLRGYKIDGIDESTGQAIYHDTDGDGSITDADRCNIGNGIPDFTYGATLSLSYKNVDFMAYGAGSAGAELMYGTLRASSSQQNRPKFIYDNRWTPTNTKATIAAPLYQTDPMYYNSDAYVFDASFFKIRQIQLGYNVPSVFLNKIGLSALRGYISLDNFFTFTSYPGADPEVRSVISSSMAIDYGGYPIAKSVTFGINITL